MHDGISLDSALTSTNPSECEKDAVYNFSQTPPPGVPNGAPGGGGVASCPWGTGCNGNDYFPCEVGYQYDRWTGWCWKYGEYPPIDPGPNVKPMIDITWPPHESLYAAPFGGTLTSRMIDPDGRVWRVDYYVNGSGPIHSTTDHPFSWTVGGVTPGTYDVQAVAYDSSQEYTISSTTRINICGPPAAPTGLWGYSAGGWVYLHWNAVPGAAGYQVEAGTAPGLANLGAWGIGAASWATPAPPSGTYYVRVRTNHSICGLGPPSADVPLTVP